MVLNSLYINVHICLLVYIKSNIFKMHIVLCDMYCISMTACITRPGQYHDNITMILSFWRYGNIDDIPKIKLLILIGAVLAILGQLFDWPSHAVSPWCSLSNDAIFIMVWSWEPAQSKNQTIQLVLNCLIWHFYHVQHCLLSMQLLCNTCM